MKFNYLIIFVFIYLIGCIYLDKNDSKFNISDNSFVMTIKDYEINNEYIKLTLCNVECIVGTYYGNLDNLKYGIKVMVEGDLKIPSINTVPNNFNYKKYLNNNDIYYLMDISYINVVDNNENIIYKIRNYINNRIYKIDNSGYMKGLILGNSDNIDNYDNYQVLGVTHLFAISGMHVSVIVLIIDKLLYKFNKVFKFIIISIVLILYGSILYYPASLLRTIIYYLINNLCKLFKIDISSIKKLFICFCILILINYKYIYNIGFIYSFITVGGIFISNKYIKSNNKLLSNFKLSLVAFLFSLPITLYNFYCINLLSILFNIIYIFYITVIIYPLSLIVFIIPYLYDVYLFFINILVNVSNWLSKVDLFIIYMKFNIMEIIIYYILLILFIYKSNYIYLIFISLLIIIDYYIPYLDSSSYVYYFDVGQGDSSLINSSNRKDIILIDTGGIRNRYVSDSVINYLHSISINKINTIIITHGDYDHMGDIYNYINNIKVDKVILNCGEYNELELNLINVLNKKEIPYYSCIKELDISDNKLYFLNNNIYDNENDNSSVIYTKFNKYKFLFMGDASTKVEEDIISNYNLQDIDVLKVGHHGSKTSTSKGFVNVIKPHYGIISVGRNNLYNHPNKSVLDTLNDSIIYRTDIDGSIMFMIRNNELILES